MLRFLVLAIIVPGNITKRGTGLVGGLGWKDESDRGLESFVFVLFITVSSIVS
jgi:hypothetical protein